MFEQANRLLSVSTPLGEDALLLEGFEGREAFSELFEYRLDLLSDPDNAEGSDIDPKDIVGKAVAFQVLGDSEVLRTWHGIVRRFVRGGLHSSGGRSFQAVIVPWAWFLTKRSTCRIFQEKNVVDIVTEVFEDAGFSDFEFDVSGDYPAYTYCVQYRETDMQFVARLLEEEGIAYSFRHEEDKHVLVISDSATVNRPADEESIVYSEGTHAGHVVSRWHRQFDFVTGKWSHTDYDFEAPRTDLHADTPTVVDLEGVTDYERYEYPGRYVDKAHGSAKAKALMEAEESTHEVVEGISTCPSFGIAVSFSLESHSFPSEEGQEWAITEIRHTARDDSYVQGGGNSVYRNSFRCIPSSVTYRPRRATPKPLVHGPQTAVVVGPSGEEIHTDEYGRVKVQFHWDRVGIEDDKSSCWIRVAQIWAGKKWGFQHLPRVGQEVVVEFLDGDPDRPIVTGSVFNDDNKPIYDLPANKTQSGVRTRSTKEGGADKFNEIRFEDKKDSEHIYIRAQKDEHHLVQNNFQELVEGEWHRTVKGDSREILDSDHHFTLTGDQFEKIGGDNNLEIVGDDKAKIGGARNLDVGGDQNVAIGGDESLDVGGAQKHAAGGNMSRKSGGDIADKAAMNYAAEGGMNVHVKGGMNVVVEAGMQLTLKAGAGFITIGPAGVDISGPLVKINSGGAAGSGGGCSPESPASAAAPDEPEEPVGPMAKTEAATGSRKAAEPRPFLAGSVVWTSPQAHAFANAHAEGAAFCPT